MTHITPYIPHMGQTPRDLRAALGDPDLEVGIDWLTVSFPCPRQSSFIGWHSKTWKRGPSTVATMQMPFHPAIRRGPTLRLTYIDSPHQLATFVSFNPSRVIDPNGTDIASTEGALHALHSIVAPMVPTFLKPPPVSDWGLYRLDLAKDVETGNWTQQLLRDVVEPMYRPRHHTFTYYNGPGTIGTVGRRSVTRPRISVYDKAAECGSGPERVRFEVQYRREVLRTDLGGKVANLDDASARLAFQRELGPIVSPPAGSAPRLTELNLPDTDLKTAREMLGILTTQNAGVHVTSSPSAQKRYRAFLRKYGLTSISEIL